ncbi:MAG: 50S ribosomal protein L30 [Chromatiales bacterium]|nr:50S ribosomal protein L30 [Chromatiales bacterium]
MATAKKATQKAASAGKVKLTLVKSKFGRLASHKACVSGLGLRRMHHSVVVADTPENRGMINRIAYMLRVESV